MKDLNKYIRMSKSQNLNLRRCFTGKANLCFFLIQFIATKMYFSKL